MSVRIVKKYLRLPTSGPRLGRHVRHDPRSWYYPARKGKLRSVMHSRHGRIYDQGETNSCTGHAAAAMLMTTPLFQRSRKLVEGDALNLYARATRLDRYLGVFPVKDTGSSGLAVMKVAKQLGYVRGYGHAFGIEEALRALVVGPVITGVNWYESFDRPQRRTNRLVKTGRSIGGHEFVVVGLDTEEQTVRACNSWGSDYGDRGYFEMTWELWDELLQLDGDVTTAYFTRRRS